MKLRRCAPVPADKEIFVGQWVRMELISDHPYRGRLPKRCAVIGEGARTGASFVMFKLSLSRCVRHL